MICYESSLSSIQVSGSEAGEFRVDVVGVEVMKVQSSSCNKGAGGMEIAKSGVLSSRKFTGDPCADNAGADVVGNDSGVSAVMIGDSVVFG